MEKVKVTRDVYDALRLFEKLQSKPLETAFRIKCGDDKFITPQVAVLNELHLEELVKCLILGYELEETTEEKLLRYYKERCEGSYSGRCVKDILNILNIEIKGVNA